jgi:hypothetical protein
MGKWQKEVGGNALERVDLLLLREVDLSLPVLSEITLKQLRSKLSCAYFYHVLNVEIHFDIIGY